MGLWGLGCRGGWVGGVGVGVWEQRGAAWLGCRAVFAFATPWSALPRLQRTCGRPWWTPARRSRRRPEGEDAADGAGRGRGGQRARRQAPQPLRAIRPPAAVAAPPPPQTPAHRGQVDGAHDGLCDDDGAREVAAVVDGRDVPHPGGGGGRCGEEAPRHGRDEGGTGSELRPAQDAPNPLPPTHTLIPAPAPALDHPHKPHQLIWPPKLKAMSTAPTIIAAKLPPATSSVGARGGGPGAPGAAAGDRKMRASLATTMAMATWGGGGGVGGGEEGGMGRRDEARGRSWVQAGGQAGARPRARAGPAAASRPPHGRLLPRAPHQHAQGAEDGDPRDVLHVVQLGGGVGWGGVAVGVQWGWGDWGWREWGFKRRGLGGARR
jgi:hypothetical protein